MALKTRQIMTFIRQKHIHKNAIKEIIIFFFGFKTCFIFRLLLLLLFFALCPFMHLCQIFNCQVHFPMVLLKFIKDIENKSKIYEKY